MAAIRRIKLVKGNGQIFLKKLAPKKHRPVKASKRGMCIALVVLVSARTTDGVSKNDIARRIKSFLMVIRKYYVYLKLVMKTGEYELPKKCFWQ